HYQRVVGVLPLCLRPVALVPRLRVRDFQGVMVAVADGGERDGGGGGDGDQGGGRRVAAGPRPGPLGRPGRAGGDRLVVEEPAEVVGQGQGGGVPPGRLLPQARQRDRLQVA